MVTKKKALPKDLVYKNQWLWIGAIIVATVVVYLPALRGSFTSWDDGAYIQDNPMLKSLSWSTIKAIFSTNYMGNYHPLAMLSLAFDYQVNKFDPFVFHLTNLLLHIANSLLVFFSVRALTRRMDVAIAAGLLFGVHALHVESVAWISERKDVIYAFFYLLAMFSYIRFTAKNERKWFLWSVFFFLLSCFSKGQAVSFVFTLVLIDFYQGRKAFSLQILLEKVPFFILSLIFGFIALNAQREVEATMMVNFPIQERIAFASYGLVMYLLKLIVPFSLSTYYPYPILHTGLPIPAIYWICILPALGIFGLLWVFYKRSKALFFALGFFLLNIIFLLQLLPVGRAIMADRYAYIPSIGYCFFFGWLIGNRAILKNPAITYAIAACYLVLLGFLTFERTQVWKNSLILWTDVIAKNRHVPIAWFNRGNVYSDTKDYKKAVSDYTECLKEDPRYITAYINRGQAKTKQLDYLGAVADYDELLTIDSMYANAYINRAMAKRMLHDLPSALHDYNVAIGLKPDQSQLYTSRGSVKFDLKDFKGALEDYDRAISMDQNNPVVYSDRAMIKKNTGDLTGAMADYDVALSLNPANGDLYNNRGNLKFQSGDSDNAIKDYSEAIRCNPKDPLGFQNRGTVLYKQKKYAEALRDFSAAITLSSSSADLYFTRALIRKELNDLAGARSDYTKAVELNPTFLAMDIKSSLGVASLQSGNMTYTQCFSMGQAYENQGKIQEAINQYRKSVELKPDYAEGWLSLGTAYAKTNKFTEAVNCFNKSINYKKNNAEAMADRGIVKATLGKIDDALKDLAEAITMNPGYATAYYNRALVYLNTGKKEKACVDLKKAVELGYNGAYAIYQKECQGK